MKKKIFSILFLAIIIVGSAQSGIQSDNTFNKSESGGENSFNNSATSSTATTNKGIGDPKNATGNPNDVVPINQYIPLLFLVGTVIIASVQYRKKRIG